MQFFNLHLVVLSVGLTMLSGCAEESCKEHLTLELRSPLSDESKSFCVFEAITEEERKEGLLAYPPLAATEGLLIVFPLEGEVCITTEEMTYPIDVLFLNAGGLVVETGCNRTSEDEILCIEGVKDVLEILPQSDCEDAKGWSALK